MSSTPSSIPAVLIIHGAWHTPGHFTTLSSRLRKSGFEAFCPQLPTSNDELVVASLDDDVAVIRQQLEDLVSTGRYIIILAHSYGGIVASNASRSFSVRERQAQALVGGIVHMIYMCAGLCLVGESMITSVVGDADNVDIEPVGDGLIKHRHPIAALYSDVEQNRAEELAKMLKPWSVNAAEGLCIWQPWAMILITYTYTTKDAVLVYENQKRIVEKARKAGASIFEESFDAAHSPFESMPDRVSEAIERAWQRYQDSVASKATSIDKVGDHKEVVV